MQQERLVTRMDSLDKIKSKTCPSCRSVFITSTECESCGLQFNVDPLGEPYGDKSYYGMREKFNLEWPLGVRLGWSNLNAQKPQAQRYRRFLEHRLEILTQYFFKTIDEKRERRKHFLIEYEDLLEELRQLGADMQKLFDKCDEYSRHPLYSHISDLYLAAELKPITKTSAVGNWLNEPIGGLLRPSFLLKCFLGSAVLIYVAIVLFPYLALRR